MSEEKIVIPIDESSLDNQVENIVSHLDVDRKIAERLWDLQRYEVEKLVEEYDKNWSDEVIDAFTNLMISINLKKKDIINNKLKELEE